MVAFNRVRTSCRLLLAFTLTPHPFFSELAPEEELAHLSQLCLRLGVEKDLSTSAEALYTLDRALQSAAFWEAPRLRGMLPIHLLGEEYANMIQLCSVGKLRG